MVKQYLDDHFEVVEKAVNIVERNSIIFLGIYLINNHEVAQVGLKLEEEDLQ